MKTTLFVAATRPAMKFGVTLEVFIMGFCFSSVMMILLKNPVMLTLYLPIHLFMYILCKDEPRALSLIILGLNTKLKSIGLIAWKASTGAVMETKRK